MLALIRNRGRKIIPIALLFCGATALVSCASKEPPALVSDPSTSGHESALPWNEQKKWEQQGQFAGGFTDQRR